MLKLLVLRVSINFGSSFRSIIGIVGEDEHYKLIGLVDLISQDVAAYEAAHTKNILMTLSYIGVYYGTYAD